MKSFNFFPARFQSLHSVAWQVMVVVEEHRARLDSAHVNQQAPSPSVGRKSFSSRQKKKVFIRSLWAEQTARALNNSRYEEKNN
jgi:hypothetical protein